MTLHAPRPAGAAVELGVGAEEGDPRDGADPGTLRLDATVVPVHRLALKRPLRTRLHQGVTKNTVSTWGYDTRKS